MKTKHIVTLGQLNIFMAGILCAMFLIGSRLFPERFFLVWSNFAVMVFTLFYGQHILEKYTRLK